MAIETLVKEADGLTDNELEKVCEYIRFIKYQLREGKEKPPMEDEESRRPPVETQTN